MAPAQSKVSVAAAQSVVQVQEEPLQLPSQSLVNAITAIAMAPRRVGLRSWSPSQPKLTYSANTTLSWLQRSSATFLFLLLMCDGSCRGRRSSPATLQMG